MMGFPKKIKAIVRDDKRTKKRFSIKGGGLAAQTRLLKTNKNYRGLAKALKPKIGVTIRKKK